jgi:hypothetical protein
VTDAALNAFVAAQVPPWWTDADDAEFELVTLEFVEAAWLHRERCAECRARRAQQGAWCRPLQEACQQLLDWFAHRKLESEAGWLRALERLAQEVPE